MTACVAWGSDGGSAARDCLDSVLGRRTSSLCERRVVFNVSGLRFETHLSTVERFGRTLLGDATRRDRWVFSQAFLFSRPGHLLPPHSKPDVRLSVSVRLLATTDRIVMKILPKTCLWMRKNWLNFGSHPPLDHEDPKKQKLKNCNSSIPATFQTLHSHSADGATLLGCVSPASIGAILTFQFRHGGGIRCALSEWFSSS